MRRGHASTKVPNVKLRPPKASSSKASSSSRSRSALIPEDEENGDFDSLKTVSRPLKGVIVCCTGIKEKVQIMAQATELGATSCSDFTDRVTHLIAQVPGSAKYNCALERGVQIMKPSWITSTYQNWLKGLDISLDETMAEFRLPPFSAMNIGLTGEQDISRRVQIGQMVQDGNGRYMKEVGLQMTHLLVCSAEALSNQKVLWAQDINEQRRREGMKPEKLINIVWVEWALDCVQWKGKWTEADYSIDKPRPKRRPLPPIPFFEPPSFNSCSTSTQRPAAVRISATTSLSDVSQAARGAPDEVVETASRKPSQSLKESLSKRLWDEIRTETQNSKGKSREVDPQPTKRRKTTQSDTEEDEANDLANITDARAAPSGSTFLAKMDASRATAFTTKATAAETTRVSKTPVPFNQSPSVTGTYADGLADSRVFSGLKLRTVGTTNDPVVLERIQELGGTPIRSTFQDNLSDADYVIIRLQESQLAPKNHPLWERFRTECWLEACDLDGSICSPEECVTYTPLKIALPLEGAEQVRLVYSGLDAMQSMFLKRLCITLGITIADRFNRQITHLICPARAGPKYDKSVLWNIPVHDLDWIWQVARTGRLRPKDQVVETHILPDITNSSSEGSASGSTLPEGTIGQAGDVLKPTTSIGARPFGQLDPAIFSNSPFSSPSKSPTKLSAGQPSPTRSSGSPAALAKRTDSALGPAITALIGKHRKEEPEIPGSNERPKRTRPPSRSTALFSFAQGNRATGSVSPTKGVVTSAPLPSQCNAETASENQCSDTEQEQSSMQVVYHDPAQQAEKQKLMAILSSNEASSSTSTGSNDMMDVEGQEKVKKRPAPRRKTRNNGF
ncbi:hypothetical protein FRC02_001610 [Tulasnella sp. 418]|nr:hypothetical protein FRC02_001610 [Tulasnella sp. 418]